MPCDQYKRMQEKLEMIMDIQAELQATQAGEIIGPDGVSILTKQFNKRSLTALGLKSPIDPTSTAKHILVRILGPVPSSEVKCQF